MGEPLYNFDAVRDALLIVADGEGIAISKRRITLSTSGVVPNIARTGSEIGCMLAVSLHAVRDDLRNELVPLNRKYPIAELLEVCRNYPGVSNAKRITFEYVMLACDACLGPCSGSCVGPCRLFVGQKGAGRKSKCFSGRLQE